MKNERISSENTAEPRKNHASAEFFGSRHTHLAPHWNWLLRGSTIAFRRITTALQQTAHSTLPARALRRAHAPSRERSTDSSGCFYVVRGRFGDRR